MNYNAYTSCLKLCQTISEKVVLQGMCPNVSSERVLNYCTVSKIMVFSVDIIQ